MDEDDSNLYDGIEIESKDIALKKAQDDCKALSAENATLAADAILLKEQLRVLEYVYTLTT